MAVATKTKTLRVAVLYRVSTKKQVKKRNNRDLIDEDLPLQRKTCEAFIEGKKGEGWVHTGIEYIEGGVSAFHTHTSRRKVLMQAYEDAKAGKYDILIVYKLDRFGRRSAESLDYAKKFLRVCRIWVVSKNAEFTNANSVEELMNFIEFWSAKKSSEDTKDRVADRMRQLFLDGLWTGGVPPYGYRSPEMHVLEKDPQESATIRLIYDKYLKERFGLQRLAKWLNEHGYRKRGGGLWEHRYIRSLMDNPIYKGYPAYGKMCVAETEWGDKQVKTDESEWLLSPTKRPEYAIVTEEEWELARTQRKRRQTKAKDVPDEELLLSSSDLLVGGRCFCGCGSQMTSRWGQTRWTTKAGESKKRVYRYYQCSSRTKYGKTKCGQERYNADSNNVDEAVLHQVKRFVRTLVNDDFMKKFYDYVSQAKKHSEDGYEAVNAEIAQLKQMQERAKAAMKDYFMGKEIPFSPEEINEMLEDSKKRLAELELQRDTLATARTATGQVRQEDLFSIGEVLKDFDKIVDNADPSTKQEIVLSLVEKVIVQPGGYDIHIKANLSRLVTSVLGATKHVEVSAALSPALGEIAGDFGIEDKAFYQEIGHGQGLQTKYARDAELIASFLSSRPDRKSKLSDIVKNVKTEWKPNTTYHMDMVMRREKKIKRVASGEYALVG